ncbi:MAG: 50S ribosomal protein L35 [Anaeromyxobacteraceae bacterium]
MPKLKTKSAAKKRFQVKKSGAVKFRHAGVRHLATFGKTKKQKVGLRGTSHLDPSDAKKIKENFPYAR